MTAVSCRQTGGGWNNTLDASADGPYCPGMHPPYDAHMSESCLSLNVFTPIAALHNASALPIFVWIYGGSLVLGSVASYGPIENLVTSGRAMLVAMNYRLGALGFAALPELAAADPRGVSGNLGILDQQLALSWVANNAAAFGGDPSRVTLIGQSSGGTSILAHLAAPASRGLFHAAISLSASPNISLGAADKLRQDDAHWFRHTPCANATRGTPAVLACLRNASVAELQGALEPQYDFFDFNSTFASEPVPPGRGIGGPPGRARWGSLPYVDGVTITRTSMEAARDGYAAPLLLQNLEGELDYDPDDALARLRSRAAAASYIEGRLAAGFGAATARRLYRLYAAVGGANETLAAAPAYALNADSGVTCGQLALARAAGAARRAEAARRLSFVGDGATAPPAARAVRRRLLAAVVVRLPPVGLDRRDERRRARRRHDRVAAGQVRRVRAGRLRRRPRPRPPRAVAHLRRARRLPDRRGRRLARRRQRPRVAAALRPRRHRRGGRDGRRRRFEGGGVRRVGSRRRGRGVVVDQLE